MLSNVPDFETFAWEKVCSCDCENVLLPKDWREDYAEFGVSHFIGEKLAK